VFLSDIQPKLQPMLVSSAFEISCFASGGGFNGSGGCVTAIIPFILRYSHYWFFYVIFSKLFKILF